MNLINLDAKELVFEVVVEVEAVSVFHVFPAGVLVEDACLSAGQGLQGASELSLLCARSERTAVTQQKSPATITHFTIFSVFFSEGTDASGRADLLHAEFFPLVEHQQHQCLEEGNLQLLLALREALSTFREVCTARSRSLRLLTLPHLLELSLEHRVAQCGLPLQLPAAVLPQVKQLEHLLQFHHLKTTHLFQVSTVSCQAKEATIST